MSSTNGQGPRRLGKVNLTTPSGCDIEVIAVGQFDALQLLYSLRHSSEREPCRCRIHPDQAQEQLNNETLAKHACGLDLDPSMVCATFAVLKSGSNAVEPEHRLQWDAERMVWLPRNP